MSEELRVVTFITKPYVYRNRKNELVGTCIKILNQLSNDLGFNYKINCAKQDQYGVENTGAPLIKFVIFSLSWQDEYSIQEIHKIEYFSTLAGKWTGLIGELQENRADIAVQTISVTENRSKVVNFTAPFTMTGITAMMEEQQHDAGTDESENHYKFGSAHLTTGWKILEFKKKRRFVLKHCSTSLTTEYMLPADGPTDGPMD